MFEHLEFYSHIVVTGPQRSGTRIMAKAIAHDTGHRYVDEVEIHTDSLYALQHLILTEEKLVVQCPALSMYAHMIKDALIIMVARDIGEILASQDRIGWTRTWGKLERIRCGNPDIPSAVNKYAFWQMQRHLIDDRFEITYESLREHPLWVEDKTGWGFAQTEEGCLL